MSGVLIISYEIKLGHYPDFFSYNTKFDPNPRRGFAILRYAQTDVEFFACQVPIKPSHSLSLSLSLFVSLTRQDNGYRSIFVRMRVIHSYRFQAKRIR